MWKILRYYRNGFIVMLTSKNALKWDITLCEEIESVNSEYIGLYIVFVYIYFPLYCRMYERVLRISLISE